MAEQQFAVAIAEVHTITLTITEIFAIATLIALHPTAVTIQHVAVLPDVHEVVFVDIALIVVSTDTRTGSDGTVGHYRSHADPSLTGEETITYLTLVVAKETLTAIVSPDAPLLANLLDKFEDPPELLVRESHHRIKKKNIKYLLYFH